MKQINFRLTKILWNKNQNVSYINKRGGVSRGKITYLETHYSQSDGKAYHIYCVHTEGHTRSAWVSEKDIIEGD